MSDGVKGGRVGAGGEHVDAADSHAVEDFSHLFRRFTGGQNHFRQPGAERPVVIDLGKSDVLKWKARQFLRSVLRRQVAFFDIFEQTQQRFLIHDWFFPIYSRGVVW